VSHESTRLLRTKLFTRQNQVSRGQHCCWN